MFSLPFYLLLTREALMSEPGAQASAEDSRSILVTEIKSIEATISFLETERESACRDATKELRAEILRKLEEKQRAEASLAHHLKKDYLEIAEMICEIQRLSFLLYCELGVDLEFSVKHHVQWIEIKLPGELTREWICYGDSKGKYVYKKEVLEILQAVRRVCEKKGLTWHKEVAV
jgi:hypothetical protein